jgi:hypothetical protein
MKTRLLVVNGSAPLMPSRPVLYQLLGVALLQSTRILNLNSVVPRQQSMRRAFLRRVRNDQLRAHAERVELVVDLSTGAKTRNRYMYPFTKNLIRKTDATVREWDTHALAT